MSTFICSDKHYSSILKTLIYYSYDPDYRHILKYCLNIDCVNMLNQDIEKSLFTFIQDIYKQNIKAYNNRYNDKGIYQFSFDNDSTRLNDLQLIKALDCVAYQCNEYQKKTTQYFQLLKLIDNLKAKYIYSLPEYKSLKWSID